MGGTQFNWRFINEAIEFANILGKKTITLKKRQKEGKIAPQTDKQHWKG